MGVTIVNIFYVISFALSKINNFLIQIWNKFNNLVAQCLELPRLLIILLSLIGFVSIALYILEEKCDKER